MEFWLCSVLSISHTFCSFKLPTLSLGPCTPPSVSPCLYFRFTTSKTQGNPTNQRSTQTFLLWYVKPLDFEGYKKY